MALWGTAGGLFCQGISDPDQHGQRGRSTHSGATPKQAWSHKEFGRAEGGRQDGQRTAERIVDESTNFAPLLGHKSTSWRPADVLGMVNMIMVDWQPTTALR